MSSASPTAPASRPARTVEQVEAILDRQTPQPYRRTAHHLLILHGRYVCKARKPECWRCVVRDLCRYKPKTPPPDAGRSFRAGPFPAPLLRRRLLGAPIAQLDRALPSEGRGQRFESSWVRHSGSLRNRSEFSLISVLCRSAWAIRSQETASAHVERAFEARRIDRWACQPIAGTWRSQERLV